MKIRYLLRALPGLALAMLFPAAAEAQWCQSPEGPYWCGDPDACIYKCGLAESDCTTPCDGHGTSTTCGAFQGLNPADYDSDGVATGSDNCACTANADQANCDGDAWGDACDPANEKWVFVQDQGRCDVDYDLHGTHRTVEQYGTVKYQNQCDGAVCYDRYLISDADCYYDTGCGSSHGACCDCHYPFSWCISGTCPTPSCPF